MKVLVLGGTGAMGAPVVQILAQRGHDVFVTSRKEHTVKESHVHYIKGNGQDMVFIKELLLDSYDAVIDFMVYSTENFQERLELFLQSTKQYIFLSSARVYAAQEGEALTEKSPRLLDVTQDEKYRETDEYALAKAREENLLINAGSQNWTIIRPYITYNDERLQLGVLEKENWLQRALRGKAIVFSKDIAAKYTTLTYGYDVSLRIADLIGKEEALGQVYHIATEQSVRWEEILNIYLDVLTDKLGSRPRVYMTEDAGLVAKVCKNEYQIRYDRLYDRRFDNRKIQEIAGESRVFMDVAAGLRGCLERFLDGKRNFYGINWRVEGTFDRITGDKTDLKEIPGWKNKVKYFLCRYIGF